MKNTPKLGFIERLSKIYNLIGIFLIFVAFCIVAITFYPQIWYSINKQASQQELQSLTTIIPIDTTEQENNNTVSTLPPLDPSLSATNTIIITSIGVNSSIIENANAEEALKKGIWRATDWGNPEEKIAKLPTIIAAHRFGYIYWSAEFRKTSSFFYLPKTKVGDTVQITWNQRLYEYVIYKSEDNSQVTDYDADLILYTCRMYNSPIRVFRYLHRIN
ncbi:MAG: hypothetical protein US24_C0035G0006 [candidate division WS6 bacterium GW2011_GWC2_36_7]|uniref:Sortase family protein n=1 Tax=candidate division WS6 bacterium GW2011_GWC2_36_7 TaxID=1619091 RepID=A0A0G0HGN6_9BACT|nr:MAG: hypothetical protein US24_C0035G0006 [candidate division WS6 bacterium GW2011_GWC2_36_7]HAM37508.1 hypothetical protein [Patescibacteria group bacterium]